MYCKKCGKQIKDNSSFCPYCGIALNNEIREKTDRSCLKQKKIKWSLILGFLVIAISVGIAMSYVGRKADNVKKNNSYQALVDDGNKYLEALDYEKAEDKYLSAISIDPKKKEPYIKLADLYIAQGKTKKASNILKRAVRRVDTEELPEIQQKYDLYTYVDDVLIPREGQCKEGKYECMYERVNDHYVEVKPLQSEKGVMNWKIMDYDNDGNDELLVLMLRNNEASYDDIRENKNAVYLQMYEMVNGNVKLQDEYWGLYPVLGYGDKEDAGIFLITKNDKTYICGSNNELEYTCADGSTIKSFVLTYEKNKFVEQAGELKPVSGSDFESVPLDESFYKMIGILDELGMENDIEKIKETGKMVFQFDASGVKTLLRIRGENQGYDMNKAYKYNGNFSGAYFDSTAFGKVIIQIKYGNITDSTEKTQSSDTQSDMTISLNIPVR